MASLHDIFPKKRTPWWQRRRNWAVAVHTDITAEALATATDPEALRGEVDRRNYDTLMVALTNYGWQYPAEELNVEYRSTEPLLILGNIETRVCRVVLPTHRWFSTCCVNNDGLTRGRAFMRDAENDAERALDCPCALCRYHRCEDYDPRERRGFTVWEEGTEQWREVGEANGWFRQEGEAIDGIWW